MLALIGGSGFSGPGVLTDTETVEIDTPYGVPSAPIVLGKLGGTPVAFLLRHGPEHRFAPHNVPYRANLWALKKLGVEGVVGVATVGGIAGPLGSGGIAVPDQLIDYTWGREVTYYDRPEAGVKHVDMTHPFDANLREDLIAAAKRLGRELMVTGTYACTQGPRLETAAEVRRYARDGADMIGMTLYPECALARELDLPYAGICVSVNHAAGMGESKDQIDFESLHDVVAEAVKQVVVVVEEMVRCRAASLHG